MADEMVLPTLNVAITTVTLGQSTIFMLLEHILKWEFSKLHPAFYDRTYSPINTALHKTAMP